VVVAWLLIWLIGRGLLALGGLCNSGAGCARQRGQ
jgi:hypothetical protein